MQTPCMESQACCSVFHTDTTVSTACTVFRLHPSPPNSKEQHSVFCRPRVSLGCAQTVFAFCCHIHIVHYAASLHHADSLHCAIALKFSFLLQLSTEIRCCICYKRPPFLLSHACQCLLRCHSPLAFPLVAFPLRREQLFLIAVDNCHTIPATLLLLHHPCYLTPVTPPQHGVLEPKRPACCTIKRTPTMLPQHCLLPHPCWPYSCTAPHLCYPIPCFPTHAIPPM